jgi:hypothetical protein
MKNVCSEGYVINFYFNFVNVIKLCKYYFLVVLFYVFLCSLNDLSYIENLCYS